jgi:hypothetical protein
VKWTKFIQPVIILGLLIWVLICEDACGHRHPDTGGTADSTRYYKNKLGETVAYIKKKDEDYAKAIWDLDSLAILFNTKPKFIKEFIQVVSQTRDTIYSTKPPITIYQGDSVRMLSQMFESNYHIAEVTIDRLGDSSRLLISSVDTLDVLSKTVKEGNIFNRRHYLQIDVKNRNPNTLITHINAYRQPLPRPKKIGIGLQVGYGFSGTAPKPYVGIGVSYNLIRF